MKKISLGLTILVLICSLSACKELKDAQNAFHNEKGNIDNGKDEARKNLLGALQGDKDSYEDLPPASDLEAYNNYVDLSNFMTGDVEESLSRYFNGVAPSEDFSPVEGGSYITTTFSNQDYDFLDEVESQADLGTSYKEIDEHALTLIPTLRTLMKVLDEAGNYGNQKGYLDDNYAKGQEIHSRFISAVNAYDEERLPYLNSLRAMLQEQQVRDLERFKKEGFESYKSGQLSFFNNAITEFKVQTQALISRVDEQKPYSEAEKLTLSTTEGSLERLIKCGSDVTSRYNDAVG